VVGISGVFFSFFFYSGDEGEEDRNFLLLILTEKFCIANLARQRCVYFVGVKDGDTFTAPERLGEM